VVQQAPSRIRAGIFPLAAGVVLGGVGGVLLLLANQNYEALNGTGPRLTEQQEQAAMSNGPLLQTLGWVSLGAGAAAVATGVVLLLLAPESPAQAAFFAVPGGGGITVSAPLP
jgi:hypothetical protein